MVVVVVSTASPNMASGPSRDVKDCKGDKINVPLLDEEEGDDEEKVGKGMPEKELRSWDKLCEVNCEVLEFPPPALVDCSPKALVELSPLDL